MINHENEKTQKMNKPWWIVSTKLPDFPLLEENLQVDVAIIGGGITGILTGYLLSQKKLNVAIFEASKIFNGTTGHTTAKITAQHGLIYDELINYGGLELAKSYYQANIEAMEMIEKIMTDLQIKCDYKKEDAYLFTKDDQYIGPLRKEIEAYHQIGIDGDYITSLPIDIEVHAALVMKNQAQFHPLYYLAKIVDSFLQQGGRIYENAIALQMDEGELVTIHFRNGKKVKASYVISASHFPFHDGHAYFAKLFPYRSYVVLGKPKNSFPGGMYINVEQPTRSIRSVIINNEEMLLIGGDGHKAGQGEKEEEHYRHLEEFAKKYFGVDRILYRWSAQDLETPDKIPYIGHMPEQKNVFVATGFRKWGMTTSHVAAKLLTDLITRESNPYEQLFSPSRFTGFKGMTTIVKENINVASQLITGKLDIPKKLVKDIKNGEGDVVLFNGKRAGAYKTEKGELFLVDTTCTHIGCEVHWNSGDLTWDCPCHGSRFSYTGEVIEGPAEKPLKRFYLENE